jgi:GH25 family lysozyme M1 (1,4-beta-N-acetylmuramidase)
MKANIIDVSNWQGNVNFDSLKKAGILGVYNKATENTYHDLTYVVNRDKAREHKMAFGGYMFLHPGKDAAVQVREFLTYAKPNWGDLRPVIDVETMDGMSWKGVAQQVWVAISTFRKNGIEPIIYASPGYLTPMAQVVPALKKVDVWEANYAPRRMAVPYRVLLWQFADNYIVGSGKFDGDVMLVRDIGALKIGGSKPKPQVKAWKVFQRLFKGRWYTSVGPK